MIRAELDVRPILSNILNLPHGWHFTCFGDDNDDDGWTWLCIAVNSWKILSAGEILDSYDSIFIAPIHGYRFGARWSLLVLDKYGCCKALSAN